MSQETTGSFNHNVRVLIEETTAGSPLRALPMCVSRALAARGAPLVVQVERDSEQRHEARDCLLRISPDSENRHALLITPMMSPPRIAPTSVPTPPCTAGTTRQAAWPLIQELPDWAA